MDRAKLAAALVLLSPYTPMLFQGEEWAALTPFRYFVDFRGQPELERAVINGRRVEFAAFGWNPDEIPDPTSPETFLASKLNWSELSGDPHREMLEWYRGLIVLRKECSEFTDSRLERTRVSFDTDAQTLRIERGRALILYNFSPQRRQFSGIESEDQGRIVLTSRYPTFDESGTLLASPESVVVLLRKDETGPQLFRHARCGELSILV